MLKGGEENQLRTVRLGEALRLVNGRAFKPTEWKEDGLPIVRIQNLNNPEAPFNYYEGDLPEKFLLDDGDLLFAWSGTPGTSFGAHIWRGGKAWLNQHIFKVHFNEKQFDKRYLQFAINRNLNEYIRAAHGGAGLAHITKGRFEESTLPCPPLVKQRRIVAEVEKQFTRLDAGVASLREAGTKARAYRDSLLNAIFDRPWALIPISEIGEVVTGSTPPTKDRENFGDAVPFLKPTDLNAGYRVQGAREHLSLKGARLATVLPAWTVLVTCIGATIGKTGLARMRCATNQQINALVPNDSIATPKWLYWMLTSPRGQDLIKRNASATTLPIINKRRFESLHLPIPPLAVQNGLIAEIETAASVVENTEFVISTSLTRSEKLRDSLLQRAFSGRL